MSVTATKLNAQDLTLEVERFKTDFAAVLSELTAEFGPVRVDYIDKLLGIHLQVDKTVGGQRYYYEMFLSDFVIFFDSQCLIETKLLHFGKRAADEFGKLFHRIHINNEIPPLPPLPV